MKTINSDGINMPDESNWIKDFEFVDSSIVIGVNQEGDIFSGGDVSPMQLKSVLNNEDYIMPAKNFISVTVLDSGQSDNLADVYKKLDDMETPGIWGHQFGSRYSCHIDDGNQEKDVKFSDIKDGEIDFNNAKITWQGDEDYNYASLIAGLVDFSKENPDALLYAEVIQEDYFRNGPDDGVFFYGIYAQNGNIQEQQLAGIDELGLKLSEDARQWFSIDASYLDSRNAESNDEQKFNDEIKEGPKSVRDSIKRPVVQNSSPKIEKSTKDISNNMEHC